MALRTKALEEKLDKLEIGRTALRKLLIRMVSAGQLLELKCEMPSCYHRPGRKEFDPRSTTPNDWQLNGDHYPILKSKKGKLTPDNVRLAHVRCNRTDFGWRMGVKTMLGKGKSLQQIADKLNRAGDEAAPGLTKWTAVTVRRAYVS